MACIWSPQDLECLTFAGVMKILPPFFWPNASCGVKKMSCQGLWMYYQEKCCRRFPGKSPILLFFLESTLFFFRFLLDPLRGPDFSDPPKTSARNFLTAFWFLSFDTWMSQKHSWHLPVFGHVLRWCSRLNHDKSITIWGEYFEHTFSHHFHSANLSRFTHLHSGTNKTCKNDDFLRWN